MLSYVSEGYRENPFHIITEITFIVLILYLVFRNPEKYQVTDLTAREEQEILKSWKPEPLVPLVNNTLKPVIFSLTKGVGPVLQTTTGKSLLNFASFNYLGFGNHPKIMKEAERTIKKYAVGSCGPRGFYGTLDCHLELENKLGELFSDEETKVRAVLYADYLGTPPSAVTAFAKKGDLIIADENVHWLYKQGIVMSRAKVIYYEHNNLSALETLLQGIQQKDNQDTHFKLNRRFIISEGVFHNSGNISNLPKLVELKNRFKYRLILDDSHGFGCLKPLGSPEYWSVSIKDIDVYVCAMDKSIGSVGAFVIGDDEVSSHQCLSSFGYVFSASAPPFQINCASTAIGLMNEKLSKKLAKKIKMLRLEIFDKINDFKSISHPDSPLLYLQLATPLASLQEEKNVIHDIYKHCMKEGLCLFSTSTMPTDKYTGKPSIRLTISVEHTDAHIETAVSILKSAQMLIPSSI